MEGLPKYLTLSHEEKVIAMKSNGVPLDSIDGGPSEFQKWVQALKKGYSMWVKGYELKKERNEKVDIDLEKTPKKLEICIKADKNTPYVTFKKVISELQDIMESRYKLLTEYKKEE
jgi:biopolymer transport protein ExbD